MDDARLDAANRELLLGCDTPNGPTGAVRSVSWSGLDEVPRVLVIVQPEGYVEAHAYNGAQVLVTERWKDQTEDEWERTLTLRWRALWQNVDRISGFDHGNPRGDDSWAKRELQMAQLDLLQELQRRATIGATLDMLRAAGRGLGLSAKDADARADEVYRELRTERLV